MSGGFKKIVANFSYVVLSNLLTVIVSSLVVLILPKIMGVEEYGYWQLYIFYLSYAGFVHLGWVDGIYLRYGGLEYDDLDKEKFFSQFLMLLIYLTGIGILFFLGFEDGVEPHLDFFGSFADELAVALKADFVDFAVKLFALLQRVFETGVCVFTGDPIGDDEVDVLGL